MPMARERSMQMYQEVRCDGGRRDGRDHASLGGLVAACPPLAYNIVGRFPSRVFAINQAWLELALAGIDLIAWTQHLLLEGELATAAPSGRRASARPSASSRTSRETFPLHLDADNVDQPQSIRGVRWTSQQTPAWIVVDDC
jgi:hypothetical protein